MNRPEAIVRQVHAGPAGNRLRVTEVGATRGDQISHGTPAALREYIHEMAGLAAIQAELVMRYAELGDDAGLIYASRRWASYTKQALLTLADLKGVRAEKEGQERGPR
jgi:hypothetical protein